MKKKLTVEDKFTKARVVLLKGDPFIGKYLLLLHSPIECGGKTQDNFPVLNDLKTMATTGTKLYYNRDFVDNLNFEEFLFVLLHQLLHCTTMHPARAVGKNEKVWNLACDLWVNSRLRDKQKEYRENRNIVYDLYKDAKFSDDSRILNMAVDDIYAEFMEQYNSQSNSGTSLEIGPGGVDDNITLESGSTNIKLGDYNPDIVKPEQVGESSSDLVDKIGEMNGEARVHAELVGTSTNLLKEQEIGIQRAQTKWYKYFDRFLKKVFNHDTSYTTPDKNLLYTRRIYKGPTKATSDKLNQVIIAMDCSSSVWNDKTSMEKFWFHINNITKKYQAEGDVLLWDGEVGNNIDISKFRVNKNYVLPRGGTKPTSIYDYIKERKIKYDVLIVLTDGYFREVDLKRLEKYDDKKTIWVVSGNHRAYKKLSDHIKKAKISKL